MGERDLPRESPRSPKEGKCLTRLLSHLVESSPSISRTIPVLATLFPTPWARVRDSSHSLLPAAHVVRLGPGRVLPRAADEPMGFPGPLPVMPPTLPRLCIFTPPLFILQGVQERENTPPLLSSQMYQYFFSCAPVSC